MNSQNSTQLNLQETASIAQQLLKDYGLHWEKMNRGSQWLFKQAYLSLLQVMVKFPREYENSGHGAVSLSVLRDLGVQWDNLSGTEKENFKNLVFFLLLAEEKAGHEIKD